jgi:hypothetical protein
VLAVLASKPIYFGLNLLKTIFGETTQKSNGAEGI